ncbi:ABC transporter permease [Tautonia sociabilis]|uniref:Transport permease protein n=1 Tax=Tautonia sociabilis TaxID=2080755 RepID=A0A432MIH3_9BACT|nr:ABC transporter permease [Tautonia sociabilis]RUL87161.1 ABC transporter permease [Tautonia sociabilis]
MSQHAPSVDGISTATSPADSGSAPAPHPLVIEPASGWMPIDLAELRDRSDLLLYMTIKAVKTRYVQSALGFTWAFIQPLMTIIVFTIVFSRVAKIPMPSDLPYPLIAFCGILFWSFFAQSLTAASSSLVSNREMLTKIYIPRLIFPLSQSLAKLVDLMITLVLLGVLMVGFRIAGEPVSPRPEAVLVLPAMILLAFVASLGLSLWFSALSVQYRDVAYGLPFVVQIGMYLTPIIYSTEMIPAAIRPIFALNPMLAVITGVRASLLGPPFLYHPALLVEGTVVAVALLVSGAIFFRRSEHLFADVA